VRDVLVADLGVGGERVDGAGLQRDFAALAELAVDDSQQPVARVDVVAVEGERLADAHPGDGEQPDQRLAGRRVRRALQRSRCAHERGDLLGLIEVGDRAAPADRQQPRRRHLTPGVGQLQVACELPRDRQPITPVGRVSASGGRPGDGMRDRHRRRVHRLQVGHETQEVVALDRELVAQGAAHSQVLLGCTAEPAHAVAPAGGHGRAKLRSAIRSTLA
jgi:hypothetical protein